MTELQCNYTCWECEHNCETKIAMRELPEDSFNIQVVQNMKSNAGRLMILNHWSSQQAHDFVVKSSLALKLARIKYLETLKH